jgi:hypothetical protein
MTRSTVLLAPFLAACAAFPLAEADCRSDNWGRRGYADGFGGQIPQDIRLAEECGARYGLEIDQAGYLKGYEAGYYEWERMIGSMDRRR